MTYLLFFAGLADLIVTLVVNIQLIRQEVPIMLGASLLLLLLRSLHPKRLPTGHAGLVVPLVRSALFWLAHPAR